MDDEQKLGAKIFKAISPMCTGKSAGFIENTLDIVRVLVRRHFRFILTDDRVVKPKRRGQRVV